MKQILEANRELHLKKVEEHLKWSRIYLYLASGWPECDNLITRIITCFNLISCVVIFIWQHVFLFSGNWNNLEYVVSVYTTLITVIQVFAKCASIHYYRPMFVKLLHVVRYEFWPLDSFKDEYLLMWPIMQWIQRILISYAISAIIFVLVWMAFPYADPLPGERQMPILCWYPFDVNKSPIHEITWIWIGYVGAYVMFGVPGFDMLFSFLLMHVCAQFRLLKVALRSINKDNRSDDATNEQCYKDMVFCVEYHAKLNNFCKDIQKTYNNIFTFGVVTTSVAIVVLFYLIQEEENPMKQIKLIGYFACLAVQISIYCLYGSILQHVSVEIRNGAYESGWYTVHPQFRLGLIHVIGKSTVPLKLTAGLNVLENETLVAVFRTAFSVSTLLRNMK